MWVSSVASDTAGSLSRIQAHVHKFVDDIHLVLVETVREAARRSVLTEAGLDAQPSAGAGRMEFLRLKVGVGLGCARSLAEAGRTSTRSQASTG